MVSNSSSQIVYIFTLADRIALYFNIRITIWELVYTIINYPISILLKRSPVLDSVFKYFKKYSGALYFSIFSD